MPQSARPPIPTVCIVTQCRIILMYILYCMIQYLIHSIIILQPDSSGSTAFLFTHCLVGCVLEGVDREAFTRLATHISCGTLSSLARPWCVWCPWTAERRQRSVAALAWRWRAG